MKYFISFLILIIYSIRLNAQTFEHGTPQQAGTLDSSNFGQNGKVITDGQYEGSNAVALQNDGKIIAAGSVGNFLLIRYNIDGSLDSSFGIDGRAVASTCGSIYAIAIQSDGKIVASGYTNLVDIALVRFMPNGRVDSSFGSNGSVITDIRRYDYLNDMALQADDKIVVTGVTKSDDNDIETSFTVRYLPDGSLDESFGDHGIVITVYPEPTEINAIAVQPDDKIVIGGNNILSRLSKLLLVRYLPDGSLDRSFGENGIATAGFENIVYPIMYDLIVQPDGKIVTAGSSGVENSFKRNMTLVRFENNGAVDNSFAYNGIAITDFGENNPDVHSEAKAVLLQPDGKIFAAGNYKEYLTVTYNFALALYQSNGRLDSAFGNNGLQTTSFMGGTAVAEDAALQSNGKIVLAGHAYFAATFSNQFALARYIGDRTGTRPIYVRVKRLLGNHLLLTGEIPAQANTASFRIERSSDGSQFSGIASLSNATAANSSNNTTSVQSFRFEDAAPLNRINYYRIKQTDNRGNITYSNIVSEVVNETTALKLYPNPVKDVLQVEGLNGNVTSTLAIYNWQGTSMQKSTVQAARYSLNVSRLLPGTYLLQVTALGEITTAKFVKK